MAWRPCKCGVVLWAEVDHYWPGRRRSSDGMIGDPTHQAEGTGSDHNPNKDGVVLALDLSHDPGVFDAHAFADWLLGEIRAGRENRVKYLISNGRFTSASDGWEWVTYYGSDKHDTHIHVSFRPEPALYDDDRMWISGVQAAAGGARPISGAGIGGALTPATPTVLEDDMSNYIKPVLIGATDGPKGAGIYVVNYNDGTFYYANPSTWSVLQQQLGTSTVDYDHQGPDFFINLRFVG